MNNIQDSDLESVESVDHLEKVATPSPGPHSDDEIKVPQRSPTEDLNDFALAFGLWCKKECIKCRTYDGLCEVLQLLNHPLVTSLPKGLSTLQRQCRRRLPLPLIQKAKITLCPEKQPTGIPKPGVGCLFFFDIRVIVNIIMSA